MGGGRETRSWEAAVAGPVLAEAQEQVAQLFQGRQGLPRPVPGVPTCFHKAYKGWSPPGLGTRSPVQLCIGLHAVHDDADHPYEAVVITPQDCMTMEIEMPAGKGGRSYPW